MNIVKNLFQFLFSTEGYVTVFIILFVSILQIQTFWTTKRAMKLYRGSFPENPDNKISISLDDNNNVTELETEYKNNLIWDNILKSINAYLFNNKNNVSDFHILKDIVDRNCEAKEYEIESQISVPINYGLMGTMAGILIGTGVFTFGGGLEALLNNSDTTNNGGNGIIMLLGGVAVAMFTSILGIILSTSSSKRMKQTITEVEKNKNLFLTWLQSNLLPNLNNDTAQTIERLTQNLGNFNNTFASNTVDLQETLSMVTTTSEDIASTFASIQGLDITNITSANIQVYEKLKSSTDDIERLSLYLNQVNEHQVGLKEGIENIDKYFKHAVSRIDSIDIEIEESLKKFTRNTNDYINELADKLKSHSFELEDVYKNINEAIAKKGNEVNTSIDNTLEKQQELLKEHLENTLKSIKEFADAEKDIFTTKREELVLIVNEIKNISAVKEGINILVQESRDQTQQIKELTKAIKDLAEIKTTGKISYPKIPSHIKHSGIAVTTLIGITCVYLLSPLFVEFVTLLKQLLKLN